MFCNTLSIFSYFFQSSTDVFSFLHAACFHTKINGGKTCIAQKIAAYTLTLSVQKGVRLRKERLPAKGPDQIKRRGAKCAASLYRENAKKTSEKSEVFLT